ncbi:MAG: zinc-ribbon domain-containing protein [Acidobacteria bacterium]|nr:zinc-ribbon domain-containing protein [Acidobacteriota bacterium]MBE3130614.1 zinc-ribbon domain-containing protein [Acidobacteriota bacterium]
MKCPSCQAEVSGDSRFCSKCGSAVRGAAEAQLSFTKTMTTPRPGFATGSLLAGKYQIQDEVGHGGMGIVYRAEDIKLKRPVARSPRLSIITEPPGAKISIKGYHEPEKEWA